MTNREAIKMTQYAITFDLDNSRMAKELTPSEITKVYREAGEALASRGFTEHPEGSVYHTRSENEPIVSLMQLESVLKLNAPMFCKYLQSFHVFRMEGWSDVTHVIRAPVMKDDEIRGSCQRSNRTEIVCDDE
jgi:virulence-associated protein VapD